MRMQNTQNIRYKNQVPGDWLLLIINYVTAQVFFIFVFINLNAEDELICLSMTRQGYAIYYILSLWILAKASFEAS